MAHTSHLALSIQGENGDLDIKNLKQNIQKCRSQILGSTKDHFASENEVCEISQTHKKGCEITFQQKADFAALRSWLSACGVRLPTCHKYRENFKRNSTALCKMAAKSFRSKRVISQPCKILPSAWSDRLPMAVTPSFQLRIVYCLKHWIVEFLSFEMTYSLHKLDSKKCPKIG
uniref:Uncharacterized protein n=1 Tax=Vitis vinifera TaxID=29760 RepID=A5C1L8_VITVI|nr:hypothetical protein VITISV_008524 [Vitis vinifera]